MVRYSTGRSTTRKCKPEKAIKNWQKVSILFPLCASISVAMGIWFWVLIVIMTWESPPPRSLILPVVRTYTIMYPICYYCKWSASHNTRHSSYWCLHVVLCVTIIDYFSSMQFSVGHTRGSSHGGSRITRKAYHKSFYTKMMDTAFKMWSDIEEESKRKIY